MHAFRTAWTGAQGHALHDQGELMRACVACWWRIAGWKSTHIVVAVPPRPRPASRDLLCPLGEADPGTVCQWHEVPTVHEPRAMAGYVGDILGGAVYGRSRRRSAHRPLRPVPRCRTPRQCGFSLCRVGPSPTPSGGTEEPRVHKEREAVPLALECVCWGATMGAGQRSLGASALAADRRGTARGCQRLTCAKPERRAEG